MIHSIRLCFFLFVKIAAFDSSVKIGNYNKFMFNKNGASKFFGSRGFTAIFLGSRQKVFADPWASPLRKCRYPIPQLS